MYALDDAGSLFTMPHTWSVKALRARNVFPAGGAAWPTLFLPQQTAAPLSRRIPQVNIEPEVSERNSTSDGGEAWFSELSPQHSALRLSSRTAQVCAWRPNVSSLFL